MVDGIINTPVGPMEAVADDEALYSLEFTDCCDLKKSNSAIIQSIEEELKQYFAGELREFKTPICLQGTPFQERVWKELIKIPYGKTISYTELAIAVGNPKACRAVAQANGANLFPIIIPCHRVISANGGLGGYASGIMRKKWLLTHEQVESIL